MCLCVNQKNKTKNRHKSLTHNGFCIFGSDPDRARTCNLLLSVPTTIFIALNIFTEICGLDFVFTMFRFLYRNLGGCR
jgi:hypothetical protein